MVLHLGDFIEFTFASIRYQGIVCYEGKYGYTVKTSHGSYPIRKDASFEKILHKHKYPPLQSTKEVKNFYPEYFI